MKYFVKSWFDKTGFYALNILVVEACVSGQNKSPPKKNVVKPIWQNLHILALFLHYGFYVMRTCMKCKTMCVG